MGYFEHLAYHAIVEIAKAIKKAIDDNKSSSKNNK